MKRNGKKQSLWVQSSVVILKKIEKVIDYITLVGSYCSIVLRVSVYIPVLWLLNLIHRKKNGTVATHI